MRKFSKFYICEVGHIYNFLKIYTVGYKTPSLHIPIFQMITKVNIWTAEIYHGIVDSWKFRNVTNQITVVFVLYRSMRDCLVSIAFHNVFVSLMIWIIVSIANTANTYLKADQMFICWFSFNWLYIKDQNTCRRIHKIFWLPFQIAKRPDGFLKSNFKSWVLT